MLNISEKNVAVHGQRPLVMSDLNEIGLSPRNAVNIGIVTSGGDIKFLNQIQE
jgi:hypothetical protein